jgi:hypothetical protein
VNAIEQRALLTMFAAIDTVFADGDAFTDQRSRQISLGRCFRAWQQCRDVLAHQSYTPLKQRYPDERSEERAHITTRQNP